MKPQTMKVCSDHARGFVIINISDFDPERHERFPRLVDMESAAGLDTTSLSSISSNLGTVMPGAISGSPPHGQGVGAGNQNSGIPTFDSGWKEAQSTSEPAGEVPPAASGEPSTPQATAANNTASGAEPGPSSVDVNDMTDEQLRELIVEKTGARVHPNAKRETLLAKLAETPKE